MRGWTLAIVNTVIRNTNRFARLFHLLGRAISRASYLRSQYYSCKTLLGPLFALRACSRISHPSSLVSVSRATFSYQARSCLCISFHVLGDPLAENILLCPSYSTPVQYVDAEASAGDISHERKRVELDLPSVMKVWRNRNSK